MIFPEAYELLWLFESEPKLLDNSQDFPLYYNSITYHIQRFVYEIYCTFQPTHGDMDLTILQKGETIIDFHVTRIISVEVMKENDKEFLVVTFDEDTKMKPLSLYLKPFVKLSWSMDFQQ